MLNPMLIDYHRWTQLNDEYQVRAPTAKMMTGEEIHQASSVKCVISGDVAILPLHGFVEHRQSFFGWLMGGTSLMRFCEAFGAVVADPNIRTVVIDFHSPGGTHPGVPEAAAKIRAARGTKEGGIIAAVNSEACSAAYWLATACDRIAITPSGEVGSVGSFAVHLEESRALDEAGVGVTVFRSPQFKGEGLPVEPLRQESKDYIQGVIDELTADFESAVAKNRGATVRHVRNNFGQGRGMPTKQAMEAGMVDEIATFDQVLLKAMGRKGHRHGAMQLSISAKLRQRHRRLASKK